MSYISYNQAKEDSLEIISDLFDDPLGQWSNYAAFESGQRASVLAQKHTDIRVFNKGRFRDSYIEELSSYTMTDLQGVKISLINASTTTLAQEPWTNGSLGYKNSWPCVTTSLTGTTPKLLYSIMSGIDISAYSGSDKISIALPSYSSGLTTGGSTIKVTSDTVNAAPGSWDSSKTDTINFSGNFGGSSASDRELSFNLSALTNVFAKTGADKTITGICFTLISTTGDTSTFYCSAIRCVSSSWNEAPVDINTMEQSLSLPVPRNGSAVGSSYLSSFPNLYSSYNSSAIPSSGDPKPINGSTYFVLEAGETFGDNSDSTHKNHITSYFRNSVLPKTQNELSSLDQEQLSDPFNFISSTPWFLSSTLSWYKSGSNLQLAIDIADSGSTLFEFTFTKALSDWKSVYPKLNKFVFHTEFIDDKIRCRIYSVQRQRLEPIADTGQITSNFFYRSAGYIGWGAKFLDGTTKVEAIRTGDIVYGEYKTVPMQSITPVRGAQVFANQSGDKTIASNLTPNGTPNNVIEFLSQDSYSGSVVTTYQVTTPPRASNKGLQTDEFQIKSFDNLFITFDLKYDLDPRNLSAYLYNLSTNQKIRLHIPPFTPGLWSNIRLRVSSKNHIPGDYQFVISENSYSNGTSWFIKNLSVKERLLMWDLRSYSNGPWQDTEEDWITNENISSIPVNTFTNLANSNDGVVFSKSGNDLQARVRALSQFAEISNFDIKPKYAELGGFSWSGTDQTIRSYTNLSPTISFSIARSDDVALNYYTLHDHGGSDWTYNGDYPAYNVPVGQKIKFTPNFDYLAPDNRIIQTKWSFGDGTEIISNDGAVSETKLHTYGAVPESSRSDYTSVNAPTVVTLVAIDKYYRTVRYQKVIYLVST